MLDNQDEVEAEDYHLSSNKMIMTTDLEPPKKTRWETKLARKGSQTERAYKKHVENFIKVMGHAKYFT